MEELVDTLESTLNVSLADLSSDKQYPRLHQFKLKPTKNSQEDRRRQWLEDQKQQRDKCKNQLRGLTEPTVEVSSKDVQGCALHSGSEKSDAQVPKIASRERYKDQLMLSEWFVEVPTDFEENWIAIPCPTGKRCLLVASRGHTDVFTKTGYKLTTFDSLLPGGSQQNPSNITILDCLWNDFNQCYFILDILSWSKTPFVGCEAQFRFYWLQSKFEEMPDLGVKSRNNKYPLIRLPFRTCETENIETLVKEGQKAGWSPLDGLLFYHKLGLYTPGVTPLVGWLKPFMLPEVLNVRVPQSYLSLKPANYKNIQQHSGKSLHSRTKGATSMEEFSTSMACE